MWDHALVYNYCKAMRTCEEFANFICIVECTFAAVEKRKKATVLHNSSILWEKLIDIQEFIDNVKDKDSVIDLFVSIIDPCLTNVKEDVDTKDLNTWEVPLNLAYIAYAAKDAYACYEMYRRILDMRVCLLPEG
ncbi:hypothetical protein D1007_42327 [Hordeum vulgare]|nr:hypothetical protein D1007_42327 [Hordeum vulgare]